MYAVIILKKSRKRLLIPRHWCDLILDAQIQNGGLPRSKTIKIFYDKDFLAKPNFTLEVRNQFFDGL